MTNDLYCVTVYDGECYYDTALDELLIYGYEQAHAAGEYLKLYYHHDYGYKYIDISVVKATVSNEDYISKLVEYEDKLAKQKRAKHEELMHDDLAHIKELIKAYEDDYGVKPEL